MLKAAIYLLGTLSLHFTDFADPRVFFNTFLPLLDLVFLVFLIWQLFFFFSLNQFTAGGAYGLYELAVDVYDLRYDIQDQGLLPALVSLALNLFETGCLILSIGYYFGLVVDLVRL